MAPVFVGTFERQLDDKKRVHMPKELRGNGSYGVHSRKEYIVLKQNDKKNLEECLRLDSQSRISLSEYSHFEDKVIILGQKDRIVIIEPKNVKRYLAGEI